MGELVGCYILGVHLEGGIVFDFSMGVTLSSGFRKVGGLRRRSSFYKRVKFKSCLKPGSCIMNGVNHFASVTPFMEYGSKIRPCGLPCIAASPSFCSLGLGRSRGNSAFTGQRVFGRRVFISGSGG